MKSHFKLFLLLIGLLSLPLSVLADYELLIYEKGDKAEPVFSCWVTDKPILSFNQAEGSLTATVSTVDQPVTIEFQKIDHIGLKEGEKPVTGIKEITNGSGKNTLGLQFVNAQTVVVNGVSDSMSAGLYGVDGKTVSADIERGDRQVTFHLNALPQGVYIIRVGQQSFKIYKKL